MTWRLIALHFGSVNICKNHVNMPCPIIARTMFPVSGQFTGPLHSGWHYIDVIMKWRLKSPRLHCLLNRLFRRWSKKTSKLRVTGLCEGNPRVTDGFPSQKASNAENVSIWWRHHACRLFERLQTEKVIYSIDIGPGALYIIRYETRYTICVKQIFTIPMET